ncbi:FabD/lysophospholipase-like protein [Cryphonectria parasitica EP155]|uniref:FabD/lysophospholipase-like protein n=1 Tax=Cryphonectria parasitica (strain ATCC 38755 / EP155) TaxID=660469 RepID=A0A9P4Y221_CRYP1|nr:FabD/lysophospholipase-like protein [Cryphonectria parasitica EP155]KAF3765074.1 FabD/lysophospholipase-like protein [Cryphonectria parasitica EP155]
MAFTPKILSFDGGGIRGISSLLILQAIMEDIKEAQKLQTTPRPCEIFDIIGGTSTGGIIAIMLGRLGMTVESCLKAYRSVMEEAFTPKFRCPIPGRSRTTYSSKTLRDAIRRVITDECDDPQCLATKCCIHANEVFQDGSCTKTIVLAAPKKDLDARPILLRTCDMSPEFSNCAIWEVALAASATPKLFKPIKLGKNRVELVDAALGFNNPCEVLIEEAQVLYPSAEKFTILSIGTGRGSVVALQNTRLSPTASSTESTNKVDEKLEYKYRETAQYHRFSVDHGLEDITPANWQMSDQVAAHTYTYLKGKKYNIREYVDSLATLSNLEISNTRNLADQLAGKRTPNITTAVVAKSNPAALQQPTIRMIQNPPGNNLEQPNPIARNPSGNSMDITDSHENSKNWKAILD